MPKIIKHEVRTFLTNLVCATCDDGFMIKEATQGTTIDLLCDPPKFKHVCNKCGHVDWLTTCYPGMIYEYVDTTPA